MKPEHKLIKLNDSLVNFVLLVSYNCTHVVSKAKPTQIKKTTSVYTECEIQICSELYVQRNYAGYAILELQTKSVSISRNETHGSASEIQIH